MSAWARTRIPSRSTSVSSSSARSLPTNVSKSILFVAIPVLLRRLGDIGEDGGWPSQFKDLAESPPRLGTLTLLVATGGRGHPVRVRLARAGACALALTCCGTAISPYFRVVGAARTGTTPRPEPPWV